MKKKYVTRLISATPGLEESVLSLDRSVKQALSSSSSTVGKIKKEMENIEKLRLESIDPDNKIWKIAKENIDQKLNKITNNSVLVMYL